MSHFHLPTFRFIETLLIPISQSLTRLRLDKKCVVTILLSLALFPGCSNNEPKPDKSTDMKTPDSESRVAAAALPEIPPPPVAAPEGFKWVPNPAFCDEFDGNALDTEKWHDHYPGWKGRVPGLFVPSAVSIKDGFLQIKSTLMEEPQGENGEWTIACGAIQSKAQNAKFGYYECRMKASQVSTSSTFWLKNPRSNERPFLSTELDIQECIGHAQRWPAFGDSMIANTHVQLYPRKEDAPKTEEEKKSLKGSQKHTHSIGSRVCDDFHIYGCWWVDPNTMRFYLDGEFAFEITPPQHIVDNPFDQEMFVNCVCEIYTWEVTPTPEELSDDNKNTTYYDYVRAYKLVPLK